MSLGDSRYPGHLNDISHSNEGEETRGCLNKGAAKPESDVNLIPKGTAGACQRDYEHYDNKYVTAKTGNIPGVSMVLASDMLFNYCFSFLFLQGTQT